jgi:hypothetical protein
MAASIYGVRAKINRAKQHLDDFDAIFLSNSPPITTKVELESIEEQPEGRYCIGSIVSGDLPPGIGLAIGDAVHNLRSSLDHLICQLAIAAGNEAVCDHTQFPIFAENTTDNKKRIKRWIRDISLPAQAAIKLLQPYERRKLDPLSDPLWILSELDNIDKHRLLLVARPHFTQMRLGVTIDEKTQFFTVSKHPEWRPLKFGTEPLRFRLNVPYDNTRPETKVEVKAEPLVGVVFQQTGLKCDGTDIRTAVGDMITDVMTIVDDFERRFFS